MGISWIPQIRAVSSSTMKSFVVASALVAACSAQLIGHPYFAFGGKSAPCVNAANQAVPCAGAPLAYAGYPYAPVAYGKRSADAEPEADAAYFGYGYPYAYAGVPFGSSTGLDPITQGLDAATQGYVPYYGYGHHAYGHYYGKRSADEEPKAAAAPAAILGYPFAYAGVPFGSSTGLDPITQGLDAATQGYVPYYGYAHPAFYGKRSADAEAEAEAEPEAFYGHYGYPYGLGYNLGYAGYGYAGYPFAYGGIAATNAALGHAVAYTAGGVTHSSNVGVCTNYLGAVVPC